MHDDYYVNNSFLQLPVVDVRHKILKYYFDDSTVVIGCSEKECIHFNLIVEEVNRNGSMMNRACSNFTRLMQEYWFKQKCGQNTHVFCDDIYIFTISKLELCYLFARREGVMSRSLRFCW